MLAVYNARDLAREKPKVGETRGKRTARRTLGAEVFANAECVLIVSVAKTRVVWIFHVYE